MTTRFDWERGFVSSDLRPGPRHVLHVLAMRIDKDRFVIPARWQPTVTDLARDMGCDRATVMRRLNRAESAGWLLIQRPSQYDARTKHARNRYTPRFPEQVAESTAAGSGTQPAQVEKDTGAGSGTLLQSSQSSVSSDLDVIIEAIQARTGRTVERSRAAVIRHELLGKAKGTVRKTGPYLASAVQRESEPARWLPTYTPPPAQKSAPKRHITEGDT